MSKQILFALTCTLFYNLNAQNYEDDFFINNKKYELVCTKLKETNAYNFQLKSSSKTTSFKVLPLKFSSFKSAFIEHIKEILPSEDSAKISKNNFNNNDLLDINAETKRLFYSLMADILNEHPDYAPLAGKLKINETVDLKYSLNRSDNKTVGEVQIRDVEIEFYEGFIETIKIIGQISFFDTSYIAKINRKVENLEKGYIFDIQQLVEKTRLANNLGDIRFENKFGIGFSNRKNYIQLRRQRLFYANVSKVRDPNIENLFITLGDVLNYDYSIRSMTKDFSPKNQVINTFGGQSIDLFKEETSKLFETIVYSDFIGIDKGKPNGLIQTEISKRINLFTFRKGNKGLGIGGLYFIKPYASISKIEENKNTLSSEQVNEVVKSINNNNDSLKSISFVNPIEILNYQRYSLGFDYNFIFLEIPNAKLHFYINGGIRFGRTIVNDSIKAIDSIGKIVSTSSSNEYGLNYFNVHFSEFHFHFLPEERINFQIIARPFQYFLLANGNFDIGTTNSKINTSNWFNTYELKVNIRTGNNGNLFGRWRFNHSLNSIDNNFQQVQLGYSFYILKKN